MNLGPLQRYSHLSQDANKSSSQVCPFHIQPPTRVAAIHVSVDNHPQDHSMTRNLGMLLNHGFEITSCPVDALHPVLTASPFLPFAASSWKTRASPNPKTYATSSPKPSPPATPWPAASRSTRWSRSSTRAPSSPTTRRARRSPPAPTWGRGATCARWSTCWWSR